MGKNCRRQIEMVIGEGFGPGQEGLGPCFTTVPFSSGLRKFGPKKKLVLTESINIFSKMLICISK